jgi:opacity protein-like surface antigen
MRVWKTVVPLTAAALALPISVSAGGGELGVSIGGSAGSARVNDSDFSGSDTSYKIHVGGDYRRVFGGEIGYINFGRLGGDGPEARSWNVAVRAGVPLNGFTPYVKGGVAFADVEGSAVRDEYKDQDPFYGIGVRFSSARSPLAIRLEYERFRFESDVDLASAGVELRF